MPENELLALLFADPGWEKANWAGCKLEWGGKQLLINFLQTNNLINTYFNCWAPPNPSRYDGRSCWLATELTPLFIELKA